MSPTREPPDYYLNLKYPLQLIADPDGGYVAVFPDLPGCMTQGETLEEVTAMAEEARALWIETEYDRGREIPLPFSRVWRGGWTDRMRRLP